MNEDWNWVSISSTSEEVRDANRVAWLSKAIRVSISSTSEEVRDPNLTKQNHEISTHVSISSTSEEVRDIKQSIIKVTFSLRFH